MEKCRYNLNLIGYFWKVVMEGQMPIAEGRMDRNSWNFHILFVGLLCDSYLRPWCLERSENAEQKLCRRIVGKLNESGHGRLWYTRLGFICYSLVGRMYRRIEFLLYGTSWELSWRVKGKFTLLCIVTMGSCSECSAFFKTYLISRCRSLKAEMGRDIDGRGRFVVSRKSTILWEFERSTLEHE